MKSKAYFSVDISEFLFLLHRHNIRYLLISGEAVIYYGYARLTGDIDVFYDREDENVRKLYDVLVKFWEGDIPGITSSIELKRKGMVFQFGVPPNRIDLVNDIDGVRFTHAWDGKTIDRFLHKKKMYPVYYIGIDDLIKNTKAVNRHKDKDDLLFLLETISKIPMSPPNFPVGGLV